MNAKAVALETFTYFCIAAFLGLIVAGTVHRNGKCHDHTTSAHAATRSAPAILR